MSVTKRLLRGVAGVLAAGAVVAAGCQTYTAGGTYPSPHYLQHFPQYFTPDPAFQLQREKDSMLDPTGQIRGGAVNPVAPLGPPPVGGVAPPAVGGPGGPIGPGGGVGGGAGDLVLPGGR